jgi:hypothetical protein
MFLGIIQMPISLRIIIFHIVPANIPFLFYIQDMNKIGVKLDNLKNVFI